MSEFKRFMHSVNLGRSKNKAQYLSDYVNNNNDEISGKIIKNIPNAKVLDGIEWDRIFKEVCPERFITFNKDVLMNERVLSLSNIKSHDVKQLLKGFYIGVISRRVSNMSKLITENAIKYLEDRGEVEPNTWYHLFHDDAGNLNQDNTERFKDILDCYVYNMDKLELKLIIHSKEEWKELFRKFCPYDVSELNLINLGLKKDGFVNGMRGDEIVKDIYTDEMKNIVMCKDEFHVFDIVNELYSGGLKRYGF